MIPRPGGYRVFLNLRINRFLASYADAVLDARAYSAWMGRLRGLDIRGVQRSAARRPEAQRYRLVGYDGLRRQQPRLFDNAGLVSGSQRPERWLLWPSGVISPGAMRQWGH